MDGEATEWWCTGENIQRMIVVMTVVDRLYGVKAWFKGTRDKDRAGKERQVDKFLIKFYLKVMEEVRSVQDGDLYNRDSEN